VLRQAACLRQHPQCVLDDFGTGGLGGDDGGGIDAFAAWGSRRFKGITWRKIQLVQDILLQVTATPARTCEHGPLVQAAGAVKRHRAVLLLL
jgi:hypothetical protein